MTDARRREINERLCKFMGWEGPEHPVSKMLSELGPTVVQDPWLHPCGELIQSGPPGYTDDIGGAMGLARHLVDTDDGVDAVRITIVKRERNDGHGLECEVFRKSQGIDPLTTRSKDDSAVALAVDAWIEKEKQHVSQA